MFTMIVISPRQGSWVIIVHATSFSDFISHTLEERLLTGAVRVWGQVGEVPPPPLHPRVGTTADCRKKITQALKEEILFWRFLHDWTGHVPW